MNPNLRFSQTSIFFQLKLLQSNGNVFNENMLFFISFMCFFRFIKRENEGLVEFSNDGNKRLCQQLEETILLRSHVSTVEKELEDLKIKHKSLKDDADFRLSGAQKRIKLLVKGSEYKTALIDDADQ